jgi:hypothetical protein
VSELLEAAFRALPRGRSARELTRVAKLLRESGDPEVEAILGAPFGDEEARDRLEEVAERAGRLGVIVVDLKWAYQRPEEFARSVAASKR